MTTPFHEPTEDMDLQSQEWKPLKKGTRTILDSGTRVAHTSCRHGLRGKAISECLTVNSIQTAYTEARQAHGSLVAFHEYCCSSHSALSKAMEQRGHLIRRWGLWNSDLMSPEGVKKVETSILKGRSLGLSSLRSLVRVAQGVFWPEGLRQKPCQEESDLQARSQVVFGLDCLSWPEIFSTMVSSLFRMAP